MATAKVPVHNPIRLTMNPPCLEARNIRSFKSLGKSKLANIRGVNKEYQSFATQILEWG